MKPSADRDPAEIFEEARQIVEVVAREKYLDQACTGDEVLRKRVALLLRASQDAKDFFSETTTAVTQAIAELHELKGSAALAETLKACIPDEEPIGTVIGRYKLLRKLGEGGCGIVYEADQQEPVRRA